MEGERRKEDSMTEKEWQQQIIDLATIAGWHHLHVRPTIGKGGRWTTSTSKTGFPDLLLWHRHHGVLAIECKVGRNKPTPDQLMCLDSLKAAGVRTMVAWPHHWPQVVSWLTGRPANREEAEVAHES